MCRCQELRSESSSQRRARRAETLVGWSTAMCGLANPAFESPSVLQRRSCGPNAGERSLAAPQPAPNAGSGCLGQPAAMLDFFVLEASDYLERLDALVQARAGAAPSGDEFVRLARAFRGSALMANQQVMARAAQGLEAAARAPVHAPARNLPRRPSGQTSLPPGGLRSERLRPRIEFRRSTAGGSGGRVRIPAPGESRGTRNTSVRATRSAKRSRRRGQRLKQPLPPPRPIFLCP